MKNIALLTLTASLTLSVTAFAQSYYGKADPMSQKFYVHSVSAMKTEFLTTLTVSTPDVRNNILKKAYACPVYGKNISPAINWKGLPKGTKRVRLILEDGTCTLGCDKRGKFDHWVIDFPTSAFKTSKYITKTGIKANAASQASVKQYILKNGLGKKVYIGPCPPKPETHAMVIKLIAYKLENGHQVVLGKAQSTPFLFPKPQ